MAITDVVALLEALSSSTPNSPFKPVVKTELDKAGRASAQTKDTPPKKLLSINEALAVMGVGRTTLYEKLSTGEIKAIKLGRRTFIMAEELSAYIDSLKSYHLTKGREP